MTSQEILEKLKTLGSESIKSTLIKHGAREPFYGVKIEELKKIQKVVKKDYQLSLELFDSGISDAMYLAGLIADETKMTKADLQKWAKKSYWYMLSEYPVAWVASESRFGQELGLEWIESEDPRLATTGWATLGNLLAMKPDEEIDKDFVKSLLERIGKEIHQAPNRVRHVMNGYVIAAGCYVPSLTEYAIKLGNKIGPVTIDMGGTACKVPAIPVYIEKVKARGTLGKKKKTVRC